MNRAALPVCNRLNRLVIDNEKHEARNPKQYQMTEIQITKTVGFENLSIRILDLTIYQLPITNGKEFKWT